MTKEIVCINVCQLDDDSGYYLIYLDANNQELNDLSFDTIEELLEQVEFEFDQATRNQINEALRF